VGFRIKQRPASCADRPRGVYCGEAPPLTHRPLPTQTLTRYSRRDTQLPRRASLPLLTPVACRCGGFCVWGESEWV
jgi:hypothetical protein